jgi:hypothetical protein
VQCVHCEYLKLREVGQYGRLNNGRGDGVIIDYQGEIANGAPLGPTDRKNVCIGGTLHLRPAEGVADMVIHPGPCGQGFASYDEHPGYDYYAAMNTPVMAAAGGSWSITAGRCVSPRTFLAVPPSTSLALITAMDMSRSTAT